MGNRPPIVCRGSLTQGASFLVSPPPVQPSVAIVKVALYSTSAEDLLRFRLPVARHLEDAGYRIQFICPSSPFADQLEEEGFACLRFDENASFSPIGELTSGFRLGGIYRDEQPDIVHHFGLRSIVEGGTAARRAGLPWIVHSVPSLDHGTAKPPLLRPGARSVLRWAMRGAEVTVQNAEDRQLLINKGCIRPERAHVLAGDVVDPERTAFVEEPDRTPVVAFVGTADQTSDLETFVECARRLVPQQKARFAVILADTNLDEALRERLETWQSDDVVEWWPHRSIESSLAKVHVVSAPSCRQYRLRRLILSAAAMGRPVIATDTPGCRDVVRHGLTGMVVPPRDADALHTVLERLLSDADFRREMGRSARSFIENDYSARLVAKHIMAVYQRLYERGRKI